MNKKGLSSGIVLFTLLMFIFALGSLFSLTLWNQFNNTIQSMDNETIGQNVKDQIQDLGSRLLWADKLFVFFYVALLVSYLISASSMNTDDPTFIIVFIGVLIFVTIMAMFISNAWAYLIENPNFVSAASNLSFTNYVMKYYPIITFIVGVVGAVIFYARKNEGLGGIGSGGSGGFDIPE